MLSPWPQNQSLELIFLVAYPTQKFLLSLEIWQQFIMPPKLSQGCLALGPMTEAFLATEVIFQISLKFKPKIEAKCNTAHKNLFRFDS